MTRYGHGDALSLKISIMIKKRLVNKPRLDKKLRKFPEYQDHAGKNAFFAAIVPDRRS